MINNKKMSLITNITISVLTFISFIIMFTGIKFMNGAEPVLETTRFGVFRFFTVDSNLLMGITSLIFSIKLIKNKNISRNMYLLKLASTTGVALTFIVVFAYLGPISENGIFSLLQNSNLFFHLIIPVLSIITFIFFEKNSLKIKDAIVGVIPMLLYSVFYVTNILVHMENGKVSPKYDWYWFVQNGVITAFIVVPLMFLITYLISFILLKMSIRKKN